MACQTWIREGNDRERNYQNYQNFGSGSGSASYSYSGCVGSAGTAVGVGAVGFDYPEKPEEDFPPQVHYNTPSPLLQQKEKEKEKEK